MNSVFFVFWLLAFARKNNGSARGWGELQPLLAPMARTPMAMLRVRIITKWQCQWENQ